MMGYSSWAIQCHKCNAVHHDTTHICADELEDIIEAIRAAKAKPTEEARRQIHQILKRKYTKLDYVKVETQKSPAQP